MNKLHIGNNLSILREFESETIDLIYLDPPFNSKREYKAKKGKGIDSVSFKDTFTEADLVGFDDCKLSDFIKVLSGVGHKSNRFYLGFMGARLLELHRILKPTGSLYLHCDPTSSHLLRCLLNYIFGEANFRNEIVWCYTGPSAIKKDFPRKHDTILRYTKSNNYTFNADTIRIPYTESSIKRGEFEKNTWGSSDGDWLVKGGKIPESFWIDISITKKKEERVGYPTQKPLALLYRIIKVSSNEGDTVLDPFCGSGTTLEAASKLNRNWVGIDANKEVVDIIKGRLDGGLFKKDFKIFGL